MDWETVSKPTDVELQKECVDLKIRVNNLEKKTYSLTRKSTS